MLLTLALDISDNQQWLRTIIGHSTCCSLSHEIADMSQPRHASALMHKLVCLSTWQCKPPGMNKVGRMYLPSACVHNAALCPLLSVRQFSLSLSHMSPSLHYLVAAKKEEEELKTQKEAGTSRPPQQQQQPQPNQDPPADSVTKAASALSSATGTINLASKSHQGIAEKAKEVSTAACSVQTVHPPLPTSPTLPSSMPCRCQAAHNRPKTDTQV